MNAPSRRLVVALVLSAGCPSSTPVDDEPVSREWARPLGTIAREAPTDDVDAAREAFARDAWRREHRFYDAVNPGHLFASTRVRQIEIDHGLWTIDELYQLGGQLFSLPLTTADGFGGADLPAGGSRFQLGSRGGPDATTCTACHHRGGFAGAGGAVDDAMLRGDGIREDGHVARNPPALLGAGIRQRLAEEMTADLAARRDEAVVLAAKDGRTVRVTLQAKGIAFGTVEVDGDGNVEPVELLGIDEDLVVKPFGWKGTFATLRDIAEEELLVHHGLQSEYAVANSGPARMGPFGDDDPDGDGVTAEILEGQVSALTLFLAMLEVPVERPPEEAHLVSQWARGRDDFEDLGCAACHTPILTLDDPRYALPSRGEGPTSRIDLSAVGATPRIALDAVTETWRIRLYSDLRRHAMGPGLAEDRPEAGVAPDEFVTPPLWGVARSRPYLHDGRASTIEEAIELHGGEAQDARDAFVALSEAERAPLRVFLTSLTRERRFSVP